jgi:hypothetical protein
MFKIKTNYFDNLYVIIMQNTAVLNKDNNSILKFDLKGSHINRFSNIN